MKIFNSDLNVLCLSLVLITVLCFVLFLIFKKADKTKPKLPRAISAISNICVGVTGILYLVTVVEVGDNIDGEGFLITLVFAPYGFFVAIAMIMLSLWLGAMSIPFMVSNDKGKAVTVVVVLTVLCGWVLPIILFEETLVGIIVLSAKIVTAGTAIYCIMNYPDDFNEYGQQIFFDPFDNID